MGDSSKPDVLTKCGEPFLREVVGTKLIGARWRRGRSYGGTEVIIEQWYYNMGQYRFGRVLTFYGWELVRIENTETRGYEGIK